MLVSAKLTIKIDGKIIKTNQIFTMTPEEYYKYSYNIVEVPEEKILPIEIRKLNLSYSFESMEIEPYNAEALKEIKDFMLDFWLTH